jgi:hypothetical protein
MKPFIVEDRNAGEVLLQGRIGASGTIIVTAMAEALGERRADEILLRVGRDFLAGSTGGRLDDEGLAWFEDRQTQGRVRR